MDQDELHTAEKPDAATPNGQVAPSGPPTVLAEPSEPPLTSSEGEPSGSQVEQGGSSSDLSFYQRPAVLIPVVGLLLAAVIGAVVIALGARSDADSANDRADQLAGDIETLELSAETDSADLAAARAELDDAEESLAESQRALDSAADELEEAQTGLSAAEDDREAAVDELENLGEFNTAEDLQVHVDRVVDLWESLIVAEGVNDIGVELSRFDRAMNDLVGTNVTADLRECKETIANNGYATYLLIASNLIGLYEFDPAEAAVFQAELGADPALLRAVLGDACG